MDLPQLLLDCKLAGMSDDEIGAVVGLHNSTKPMKSNDGPMIVTDTTGTRMFPNTHYTLRGNKVLVLREQYGAGNLLDTYYRVFYLDTDLNERMEIVDAKYATRYSITYPSQFTPINKS